jgi:hypothetical protein
MQLYIRQRRMTISGDAISLLSWFRRFLLLFGIFTRTWAFGLSDELGLASP